MSWQVVDHITIYREEGFYAAHPNVVRTPGGDLLALFRRSPHLGYSHHTHPLFDVRACRSTDEGQSWSPAQYITADPLGGVIDFGTHTLPDGRIFLHASAVSLVPREDDSNVSEWVSLGGRPFWVRSRDDGHTWSDPHRFPPVPDSAWEEWAEHMGVCRSGLALLADDRLFLPGKAPSHPGDQGYPFFGMCWFSSDMGETWEYGGKIAEDRVAHFSEPTVHITPSGRILVLFRCHPHRGTNDYEVFLAKVYSDDGGQTWSPWEKTTMQGCPGHILGLKDGRLFATLGRRVKGERGCVARVLEPEGSDLDTAPQIVIRADSHTGRVMPERKGVEMADCGYPWSVELADGKVLVVYYYTYADSHRGIEGTVVEER